MSGEPRTAADFQAALKALIENARWGGVSEVAMSAILAAEAETVKKSR
jgi:hypothetical protein